MQTHDKVFIDGAWVPSEGTGTIDVYDKAFQPATLDGSFSDPNIPDSYSIFNIQNIGGKLYVTYAQQSHKEPDEETDHGSGFVDVFDTSGHLLQRLIAIASQRGLQCLEGDVLEDNHAMVSLAIALGFEVRENSSEPGLLVVGRDLVQAQPVRPVARERIAAPAHYI